MINYTLIGLVVLVLIILLGLYLIKNRRDKQRLNESLNANEAQVPRHPKD